MQSNLSLLEPYANCVYQRNADGVASIPIAGTVTAGVANVKAVFSRVNVGNVQNLAYALPIEQTLPVDKSGNFGGTVQVPGGWYSLTVSAGESVGLVNRVGSGEVFVIFGHSLMQGGHDQTRQLPATDERVITLLDNLTTRNNQFGPLTTKVGPFHDSPDSWGQLGDKLVKRLGVPVLFYGCAYGGSNILQSYQLLTGATRTSLPPGTTNPASSQPLEPIESVMQNYVSKTGVRAILMEHGYNDRGTPTETFMERFRYVMDYLRNTYQHPNLAVVLVQEELTTVANSLYDVETAKGLQTLIQTYPNTYKGPDFNSSFWPLYHITSKQDHLFGNAIDQFASDWDSSLSEYFFRSSLPYVGSNVPNVFPLVLYNAPATQLAVFDWVLLAMVGVALVLVIIKRKKSFMWAFLLLAVLALGRFTGKV